MRRLTVGGVSRMAERLNDTGAARSDCWREDLRKAQDRVEAEEKRRQEQLRIPRPRFRPEKGIATRKVTGAFNKERSK